MQDGGDESSVPALPTRPSAGCPGALVLLWGQLPGGDGHEDPPSVDAGFFRAHARADPPHSDRRPQLAGGQCRSSSPGHGRRSHPRARRDPGNGRAADARSTARSRRPLGDDVPARHGAPNHLVDSIDPARGASRGRRLRSEPGARDVDGARARRRFHHSGEGEITSANCCERSRIAAADRFTRTLVPYLRLRAESGPSGRDTRQRTPSPAEPCCPGPFRLHHHGTPDRRRRNLARVHVRLQFLLDHRDARPELSSLPNRPRSRRHRRRPRAWRTRDLPRGRQHHPRRCTVRNAVPHDYRCRLQ